MCVSWIMTSNEGKDTEDTILPKHLPKLLYSLCPLHSMYIKKKKIPHLMLMIELGLYTMPWETY